MQCQNRNWPYANNYFFTAPYNQSVSECYPRNAEKKRRSVILEGKGNLVISNQPSKDQVPKNIDKILAVKWMNDKVDADDDNHLFYSKTVNQFQADRMVSYKQKPV
jgi:hypothetical protein